VRPSKAEKLATVQTASELPDFVQMLPGTNKAEATRPDGKTQTEPAAVGYGRWTVLQVDAVGRRALCVCVCGEVRQLAVAAIRDGSVVRGCGSCSSSLDPTKRAEAKPTFAAYAPVGRRGRAHQTPRRGKDQQVRLSRPPNPRAGHPPVWTLVQRLTGRAGAAGDMPSAASPHGFRASFRSWCTAKKVPREVAERCLAHVRKDATEAAYDREEMLEARREWMKRWARYLTTHTNMSRDERTDDDDG
jgi:hypothetical protein